MQLEDIYKTIRLSLQERLSGPAIPSFCISWSLVNYKFFVILFSRNSVTETFSLITSICFPTSWSVVLYGIAVPVITTTIYIFAWPYPEKFIYSYWRQQQKKILELRRKFEEETPITMEEARALHEGYRARIQSLNSEITEKNSEISDLRVQLSNSARLEAEPNSVTAKSTTIKNDWITDDGIDVLKLFVSKDGTYSYGLIEEQVKLNSIRLRHVLDELVSYGMLTTYKDGGGRELYNLAPAGRKFLVTNGLA